MKTAIAVFLMVLALPNAVLAGTFTFKSCSPNTTMTVHSFNYNDPVKMVAASTAASVREGDIRTLTCATDQCFARVTVEFLDTDKKLRVLHNVSPMVPNNGAVCLKMRSWSWNTDEANVSYGRCSC